jgi:signal transduction histidine kinase
MGRFDHVPQRSSAPIFAGLVEPTGDGVSELVRWRRPIGTFVIGVVAFVATRTDPRPGWHGLGLVVLVALVAVLAGGAVLLLGPTDRRPPLPLEVLLFLVVAAGSVVLVWFEPNGAGFVGGFVLAGSAAARLRGSSGVALTLFVVVGLGVAGVVGAHRPLLPTAINLLGLIAFYRLGLYARRLRARTTESVTLLAELRETREAQVLAAALAERQHLAREMHDVLAHSLSSLVLHLEGARLLAVRSEAEPRLTDAIERAHHLAQAGLSEARQAIGTLRDDDLPGPERLATLAEEFQRDTGVPCALTVTGGPPELRAQTRLTLYRVAQEALTNVHKHARPERVEVRLDYERDGARLTVEDIATTPTTNPASDDHGYGVSGMRERAELLGGDLTAEPTATGFRVTLWAPA